MRRFRFAAGLVAVLAVLGLVAPLSQAVADSLTPDYHNLTACVTEDSPGPCYWDATTRGNSEGRTFWVDAEQVTHYPPAH